MQEEEGRAKEVYNVCIKVICNKGGRRKEDEEISNVVM